MKLRLISFKLCPFVQRVAIVLNWKQLPYEFSYVELSDPPDWFTELSPFNKVPLLQVDDQVIFESTAINEYLDEIGPPRLHPQDPLLRAQNRSWIEYGGQLMWSAFHLSVKETEQEFRAVVDDLAVRFDQLEQAIVGTPFFNGDRFSLVDATYAPLFQRLYYLDELSAGVLDAGRHPKLVAWQESLRQLDAVRDSCVPDIRDLYHRMLARRQGYVAGFLDSRLKNEINGPKSIY